MYLSRHVMDIPWFHVRIRYFLSPVSNSMVRNIQDTILYQNIWRENLIFRFLVCILQAGLKFNAFSLPKKDWQSMIIRKTPTVSFAGFIHNNCTIDDFKLYQKSNIFFTHDHWWSQKLGIYVFSMHLFHDSIITCKNTILAIEGFECYDRTIQSTILYRNITIV